LVAHDNQEPGFWRKKSRVLEKEVQAFCPLDLGLTSLSQKTQAKCKERRFQRNNPFSASLIAVSPHSFPSFQRT
jgi:hypothetical protein